ncbi:Phosphoribosylamine--glycine ligase [Liberibacter crescens BT-1]|uniref:Phosphoribosylamine--glycine ligase n=1 Tax=Liberibacter crescens (strain BT-1) TaxID=1215343 RepID=L0EVC8_LIBCB|nr:phosphoribosylamine--glycine ligase [Liberibacter crescens]AGA64810.1 Phosphoribosylamine--glycine ligase [Liberibacter crescens BT-1]AMC12868.1 phosphoribosylamine--glycine ligase [Liberibacter crescens]
MNVLLIGSGGREHALAWKIAQSSLLSRLWAIPGNPGIAEHAECVSLDVNNHDAITEFCKEKKINFVIVGPEVPLVMGIVDVLQREGIPVFGPSKAAARLEGSKEFTKELCTRYNIPTASYQCFSHAEEAREYVKKNKAPVVIKADGLAAGKGVTVCMNIDEAMMAIDHHFREKTSRVVIEEYLEGTEISFFALCDGQNVIPFTTAQDHKRAYDGDTGPNTGGMGAYSPASGVTEETINSIMEKIIQPTINGMIAECSPFIGVLFAGLMLTTEGPKLIEYNVRFGDPECQVMMMRLESDLLSILYNCATGKMSHIRLDWSSESALTVVLANKGYPGSYEKGAVIESLPPSHANMKVFHAGTAYVNNKLVIDGGRVLNVTALGETIIAAQKNSYAAVDLINWTKHGFWRKDIGWRAVS